ncbi:protein required for normal CLN1 and CLN2 G1 cyclin expression [Podochytrium sp. JEL0797]|nr:protein required for normal CLN1 and CLN2 G1 cyclin expression [Podochytrium sp. JEL0797]
MTTDPNENDTLLKILNDEKVPIHLYLEFAVGAVLALEQKEFHRMGIFDYVEKVLEMAAERGASESLRDTAYIKILHALALHFIESAALASTSRASDPTMPHDGTTRSRGYLLSKATELLNKAENIDSKNVWTAIVRGSLFLASTKLPDSVRAFGFAVSAEPNNLAALMGQGAAQFRSQDYKSALKSYQRILTLYPNLSPDPRLAIGICYYRLQMHSHARLAFERAVELNPENPDALALLARVEWNEAREEGSVEVLERAVERVKAAFTGVGGRKNGAVLNLIGEGLYFRGDYDQVEIVSKAAIANTDSNAVKAEAYAAMGKSFHSQGKFSSAFEMYSKAASLNPNSSAYQYGLGQMYIHQGEHQKALECFEKVLTKDEENLEALKKAASICSEEPKLVDRSLVYFGKLQALIKKYSGEEDDPKKPIDAAVGLFPDPVMQVELARIYEGTNPAISLKGYLNALSVMEADGSAANAVEILNNIGALYHREAVTHKDFEIAQSFYERALTASETSTSSAKSDLAITIKYNLARLHEQLGNPTQATTEFQSILETHPSYFDCYLRLAALTSASGGQNPYSASRAEIKKGMVVDRKTSLLMLGASYFEDSSAKTNLRDARKIFEEVLQNAGKNDSFALCSVGNIYLVIARFDPKQKEIHLKKALEFFDKAVRVDHKNVFGATGVGICLAELGHFDHARDVFTQVLEGAANMPSVSVNLAHVLVELGQTKLAISHYERVLKKSNEPNVYILQCLARAHYIVAKSEKDPKAMLKALNSIQRAIRSEPSKWSLWYDLALVKQQYAQIMNDQSTDKRTVQGLKKSLEGVDCSHRIFSMLSEKKEPNLGYDCKQAKERADYCNDVQRASERKIHETSVLEDQRSERLQAIKSEQLRIEQEQAEKERAEREKVQRAREEVEQKRREIMLKVQEDNIKMRERLDREEEDEARKPIKRKKQDAIVGSDESDAEGGGGGNESGGEKKKKRKRKEKKPRGEGDEEPREKSSASRKLNSKKREIVSDDDDDAMADSAPRVGRQSNLSRAVIDSDDDE